MILTNKVKIKVTCGKINHYKNLGYAAINNETILVKVNDLPTGSNVLIDVKCDTCRNKDSVVYRHYLMHINKYSSFLCKSCAKERKVKERNQLNIEKYDLNPITGKKDVECNNCKTECHMKYNSYLRNKRKYSAFLCKDCAKKAGVEKSKKTCLEKYGVENVYQSKEIKEKIKQTNLKKYGVDHIWKSKEHREKADDTCIKKYGSKNNIEKQKETCLEKYGVDNIWKSEIHKEKAKQTKLERYGNKNYNNNIKREHTCLEKYGVKNAFNNEQSKQTKLERYGNINYVETEDFKNKSKETCLIRYGVPHQMQNLEYYNKHQHKMFAGKEYKLQSGKIVKVQGYEPLVLNELFKLGYKENDLIIKTSEINREVGLIKYIFNNKEHRYYPDIFIKSENRIIEVKSLYIFKLHKEKNLAKRKACLAKNLNFNFFIR